MYGGINLKLSLIIDVLFSFLCSIHLIYDSKLTQKLELDILLVYGLKYDEEGYKLTQWLFKSFSKVFVVVVVQSWEN